MLCFTNPTFLVTHGKTASPFFLHSKLGNCKISLDDRDDIKAPGGATIIQQIAKGGVFGFRKDAMIHLKVQWED